MRFFGWLFLIFGIFSALLMPIVGLLVIIIINKKVPEYAQVLNLLPQSRIETSGTNIIIPWSYIIVSRMERER